MKKIINLSNVLLWSPFIIYLLPVVTAYFAVSESSSILGRYSPFLVVFNGFNLLFYVFIIWSFKKDRYLFIQLAYVLVILLSFIAVCNTAVSNLPFIGVILPLIRLSAGMALVSFVFQRHQRGERDNISLFLGAGVLVILLSVMDLGLLSYADVFGSNKKSGLINYRENYKLSEIKPNDILITGDSFVWGAGVKVGERFGNRLEEIYAREHNTAKVYSLALSGAGVPDYVQFLSSVPRGIKARQIIMAFYLNDLQLDNNLDVRIRGMSRGFRRGSMVLAFIQDMLQKDWTNKICPDIACYDRLIIRAYDKSAPSFEQRWNILRVDLERFKKVSDERCDNPPIFMIIPLMDDFRDYPLDGAHHDLAAMAAGAGYRVIDLLPIFREKLIDGSKYRASANDNHFDPRAHALVARVLKDAIDAGKDTSKR